MHCKHSLQTTTSYINPLTLDACWNLKQLQTAELSLHKLQSYTLSVPQAIPSSWLAAADIPAWDEWVWVCEVLNCLRYLTLETVQIRTL